MNDTGSESTLATRLAQATLVAAIPLIAFGGSVTTLGAGMAVDGWLDAEGHFLPFFPLEKWLRDVGTFVEHTHRMFGILVGLCAVATVVVDFAKRATGGAKASAVIALLAVCAQGFIGGKRVLMNSPDLAQLHGLIAQVVFGVLAVNALVHGLAWRSLPRGAAGERARPPVALAHATAVVVFAQIAVGVYYRHGLRPVPLDSLHGLLHTHLTLAVVLLGLVIVLARRLKAAALASESFGAGRALHTQARRLHALLGAQIAFGLVSWLSHDADEPERVTRTLLYATLLHVTFGALLFAQSVVTAAWTRRLAARGA